MEYNPATAKTQHQRWCTSGYMSVVFSIVKCVSFCMICVLYYPSQDSLRLEKDAVNIETHQCNVPWKSCAISILIFLCRNLEWLDGWRALSSSVLWSSFLVWTFWNKVLLQIEKYNTQDFNFNIGQWYLWGEWKKNTHQIYLLYD